MTERVGMASNGSQNGLRWVSEWPQMDPWVVPTSELEVLIEPHDTPEVNSEVNSRSVRVVCVIRGSQSKNHGPGA